MTLSTDSKARVLDELAFMFATGNLVSREASAQSFHEDEKVDEDVENPIFSFQAGDRVYWEEGAD